MLTNTCGNFYSVANRSIWNHCKIKKKVFSVIYYPLSITCDTLKRFLFYSWWCWKDTDKKSNGQVQSTLFTSLFRKKKWWKDRKQRKEGYKKRILCVHARKYSQITLSPFRVMVVLCKHNFYHIIKQSVT